ncbi:Dyp-type peroxidase domain-containing protein, partial [Kitasatospora indigofera]|uniref:Dyp-type peroxidase domain-containing protein n=1 Tax=Kitasatospora indigofera TaxID=67307 RepID=UPI0036BFE0ED
MPSRRPSADAPEDAENQQQDGTTPTTGAEPDGQASVSRRAVIGWAGAGVALGAAAVGSVAVATGSGGPVPAAAAVGGEVPFYGEHQSGIATPVQDRLHFAAFDVAATATRESLVRVLKEWTRAAAAMTGGREVGSGAASGLPQAPPDDTGEALGLPASRLTLTVGFGPSLFEKDGVDRFGLRARRPEALIDLPRFRGDSLDPARSGGDLCVQACADD